MECIHVDVASGEMYTPALMDLFGAAPPLMTTTTTMVVPPDGESSASRLVRLFDVPSQHINKDAVLAAIDAAACAGACPNLELRDLPDGHYVRIACGGRPCSGAFATVTLPKWAVIIIAVYTGKWRTEDEYNVVGKHVHSRYLYEFRNVPFAATTTTTTTNPGTTTSKKAAAKSRANKKRAYDGAPAHKKNTCYCYVDSSEAGNATRELNHYKDLSGGGGDSSDRSSNAGPSARFVEAIDGRTRLPHVLVVATRPIAKGAEVTVDYGADYNFEDFQEREEWQALQRQLDDTEARLKEALAGQAAAVAANAILQAKLDLSRACCTAARHQVRDPWRQLNHPLSKLDSVTGNGKRWEERRAALHAEVKRARAQLGGELPQDWSDDFSFSDEGDSTSDGDEEEDS